MSADVDKIRSEARAWQNNALRALQSVSDGPYSHGRLTGLRDAYDRIIRLCDAARAGDRS